MNRLWRVLFVAVMAALVLVPVLGSTQAQDDGEMMDYGAQAEAVITTIWNDGDMEAVTELIAEDVTVYLPPSLGVEPPFSGHEGYMMNAGGWRAGLPDLEVEIVATIGGEQAAALRVNITGTHTETFFGIPPTGAELAFGANILFFFNEDGQVTEEWWEWDTTLELIQLGLFTPPAPPGE